MGVVTPSTAWGIREKCTPTPGSSQRRSNPPRPANHYCHLRVEGVRNRTVRCDWETKPIERAGFSMRPFRCLQYRGLATFGRLCEMSAGELLAGQSWGEVTLLEVRAGLGDLGLALGDDLLPSPFIR